MAHGPPTYATKGCPDAFRIPARSKNHGGSLPMNLPVAAATETAIRLLTSAATVQGHKVRPKWSGNSLHEARSSGRESAHFISGKDQSRLTSAATWFMVQCAGKDSWRFSMKPPGRQGELQLRSDWRVLSV